MRLKDLLVFTDTCNLHTFYFCRYFVFFVSYRPVYRKWEIYHPGAKTTMRVTELKSNPIIIEWLQTVNVKPNSEKSYLHGMQDFTEYTGICSSWFCRYSSPMELCSLWALRCFVWVTYISLLNIEVSYT
jgi:hypothetical protein